jgi:hypothetical protein
MRAGEKGEIAENNQDRGCIGSNEDMKSSEQLTPRGAARDCETSVGVRKETFTRG